LIYLRKAQNIIVLMALLADPVVVFAQNKVVVVPLFGDEAPTHKVIFVTKMEYTGDLGGPTGADEKCQMEADLPNSMVQGKDFKAWVSGGLATDFTAGQRSFNRSTLPYRRVDNEPLADNFDDLVSGSIDNPISVEADGTTRLSSFPWTGVSSNGSSAPSSCLGWESADFDDNGQFGQLSATSTWTQAGSTVCSNAGTLICVEQ